MITIALDEQGDFEGLYDKDLTGAPIFIGGVLFDDFDEEGEFEREKRRIHHYLRGVSETVGASYPVDLHMNQRGNNANRVRKVKSKIAETLSEFMRQGVCKSIEGNYKEKLEKLPKRKGKYYIFANMVCDDGSQKVRFGESTLAREDYASNLYVHMAEDVVERLIFHNPFIDRIDHVHLELATRRVVLEGEDCDVLAEQYIKLGYQEDRNPEHMVPGKRIFCLTNKDNYRTAIQREMLDTEKRSIQFDSIGVKSIYYGNESSNNRMEFLYLADIICSNLGFALPALESGEMPWEFKRRADNYTGHEENLIFVHDTVDVGFRKAWSRLEERDYYHALQIAYDVSHMKNVYASFYQNVWFRILEKKLKKEKSLTDFKIALERLFAYTRQNNMNQDKLLYIFSVLEELQGQMIYRSGEEKAVLYKLYDTGVSAYCHIGRAEKAKEYFKMCKQYARYIDFETYIRTRSKLAVCLSDEFRYEESCELSKENKYFYEELIPLRHLILNDDDEKTVNYGITCSQLGQAYAFLRKKEAENAFQKALENMGEINSPNYLITASYLLHFYLDMKMQEPFEKIAAQYFAEKKGLREQFSYILSEGNKGIQGRFSMKFALYVFVRGIYTFYMEKLSEKMLQRLLNVEREAEKTGKEAARQLSGHPWEIIYKYLALIAYDKGYKEQAQRCMEKAETAVRNQGMIIDMICWFEKMEFAMHKGKIQEAEDIFHHVPKSLKPENPLWSLVHGEKNFREIYKILDRKIFTFMYR